jgi:RNA recognition motif-containing protein
VTMALYVGNLDRNAGVAVLTSLFEEFGPVLSVRIPLDRETQQRRGFAFVEMEREHALRAADALNRHVVLGRMLNVLEAIPRIAKTFGYAGSQ